MYMLFKHYVYFMSTLNRINILARNANVILWIATTDAKISLLLEFFLNSLNFYILNFYNIE